jgi:integrase
MARIFKRAAINKRTGQKTEGRIWWITYTQYRRHENRSLGVTDQKLAEIMKAEIERNIERGKAGLPQSFVDAYDLWQEYKHAVVKKKSPAYQKRMLQHLRPFLTYVHENNRLNLASVTVRDIEHHLNPRQVLISSKSWNDEVREIRRFFKFAIDREYLFQNPAAKIPLHRTIQYSIEIFTPDELELIFNYAYPPSVPFYKILLYTGLRSGEARNLRWSEIDLTPGLEHVKIRNTALHLTKTRRDRVVPLCQEAVVIMKELVAKRGPVNLYVFPGRKGGPRADNRNAWVACLKRIEERTSVRIDKGAHLTGVHLFRHTFATNALASGVDIRTVQEWLGHSTVMMTQRYTNLLPNQQQQQIQKLNIQIGRP